MPPIKQSNNPEQNLTQASPTGASTAYETNLTHWRDDHGGRNIGKFSGFRGAMGLARRLRRMVMAEHLGVLEFLRSKSKIPSSKSNDSIRSTKPGYDRSECNQAQYRQKQGAIQFHPPTTRSFMTAVEDAAKQVDNINEEEKHNGKEVHDQNKAFHPDWDLHLLDDPVCDAFFHGVWNRIADNNDRIFDQVFNTIPSNRLLSFRECEVRRRELPLHVTSPSKAIELLAEVAGHLVRYPERFLASESLEPPIATLETISPIYLWT
ncbi:unnamed protein product [Protopolystoma xenopodis]|uniref:Uncharacterized protein n=1 Tax=Protopolystoma xenopodis TaxID=117903 RepID=A0A3S5CLX2_9PLAT|nr:unnamed protein product [Protopolystoma xenopodis]